MSFILALNYESGHLKTSSITWRGEKKVFSLWLPITYGREVHSKDSYYIWKLILILDDFQKVIPYAPLKEIIET